jgi:hypothetical protein
MTKIAYEPKRFSADTLRTIAEADTIIANYQAQGFSLTLRQLYYQFVARGVIPNTEKSYSRIGNTISDARRAGLIDWNSIEDRTRFMRDLSSWDTPQGILKSAERSYHRDLWANQTRRVEVWIEKDALVGVIEGICNEADVPFLSCRGYVSDSEMWRQARRLLTHRDKGQQTVLLHLGDHDPSGLDMTRDIEERLALFTMAPEYIDVRRIALTMPQIEEFKPPPNPAKITDSRYARYVQQYGGESWELDALEPRYIHDLLDREISAIRDRDRWDSLYSQQETERDQIGGMVDGWKQCLFCSTSFKRNRGDSRYCSNRCRQAAYRQRMLQIGVTGEVPG